MIVRNDPRADADLEAAADWLDGFTAGSGDRFLAAVRDALRRIGSQPGLHGKVYRPPRGREVRQGLMPGTVFVVTYEVTPTEIVVWSVGHAKQRSQPWRRRMTGPRP